MNKWEIKEEVEAAAQNANSLKEMMQALGMKLSSGYYKDIHKICRKFDVKPPIYKNVGQNIVQHKWTPMPTEEWFANGVHRNGRETRKRLVRLGVLDQCSMCGLGTEWNGLPLALQLDHLNGDSFDNRIENVRILCPNCHTQTDTYGNKRGRRARVYCACGLQISKNSKSCRKCTIRSEKTSPIRVVRSPKVAWPSVEEVVKLVKDTNFSKAAVQLGCTDNAIRKFLVRNNINIKII